MSMVDINLSNNGGGACIIPNKVENTKNSGNVTFKSIHGVPFILGSNNISSWTNVDDILLGGTLVNVPLSDQGNGVTSLCVFEKDTKYDKINYKAKLSNTNFLNYQYTKLTNIWEDSYNLWIISSGTADDGSNTTSCYRIEKSSRSIININLGTSYMDAGSYVYCKGSNNDIVCMPRNSNAYGTLKFWANPGGSIFYDTVPTSSKLYNTDKFMYGQNAFDSQNNGSKPILLNIRGNLCIVKGKCNSLAIYEYYGADYDNYTGHTFSGGASSCYPVQVINYNGSDCLVCNDGSIYSLNFSTHKLTLVKSIRSYLSECTIVTCNESIIYVGSRGSTNNYFNYDIYGDGNNHINFQFTTTANKYNPRTYYLHNYILPENSKIHMKYPKSEYRGAFSNTSNALEQLSDKEYLVKIDNADVHIYSNETAHTEYYIKTE